MKRHPERVLLPVLCGLCVLFCYVFCWQYGIFGAKVDWISQHSVIPDYFRQQFYDTGELFPEFAPNIGGGQNIYNFAYYGLYSPLILPSYLMPFVKMGDYMMAVQFLCLAASVLLMYRWLRGRGCSRSICLGVSCIFLLSGPMIYHSYNQIMFVNYMPFLMLGLMGVDRYFADCRKYRIGLLTVSIYLMIMTSFYFSIGGMLVLVIYGVHCYLNGGGAGVSQESRGRRFAVSLREVGRFLIPFLLAVGMSCVLLLPTAFTLLGREGSVSGQTGAELFFPEIRIGRFLYSSYGIGLSSLGITALIAGILWGCGGTDSRDTAKGWRQRVLPVSCAVILTVPVFAWLLNGGLYVRDKAMIPFLPLLCYLIAEYLMQWEKEAAFGTGKECRGRRKPGGRMKRFGRMFLPGLCTLMVIYWNRDQSMARHYWHLLMVDGVIMLLCCGLYVLFRKRAGSRPIWRFWQSPWRTAVLWLPAVSCLIVFQNSYHTYMDRMVSRDFYQEVTDGRIGALIADVLEQEPGFYRMEQLGSSTENAADLNRIWNMEQYSSSCYSSSYNADYRRFREQDFGLDQPFRNFLMQSVSCNPVWQRFMGVKYVVSRNPVPGYELLTQGEDWNVYVNDQVSPIAYATDRVMAVEDYEKLQFPYNQTALLDWAVVDHVKESAAAGKSVTDRSVQGEIAAEDSVWAAQIEPLRLELSLTQEDEGWIQKNGSGYHVQTGKCRSAYLDIPDIEGAGQRVLFLRFQIRNLKDADVSVWLEYVQNKLTAGSHIYYNGNSTFTYGVMLEAGWDRAELRFGAGEYEISEMNCFLGILNGASDGADGHSYLYQSSFGPDQARTKGNVIAGSIQVERPGYFITTIPYDEGFEIQIDGEKVDSERVNLAFLGCRISEGMHDVKIVYHAPGTEAGKALSMLGAIVFAGILLRNRILKSF